ncbi:hypothetical protein PG990_009591 [Apiospora arundinis]|uniref:Uncharacterized protein n=1 Tax=Apiospora arundinis TaxID=335852 RepID=A0ABR2ITR8_9PEZI
MDGLPPQPLGQLPATPHHTPPSSDPDLENCTTAAPQRGCISNNLAAMVPAYDDWRCCDAVLKASVHLISPSGLQGLLESMRIKLHVTTPAGAQPVCTQRHMTVGASPLWKRDSRIARRVLPLREWLDLQVLSAAYFQIPRASVTVSVSGCLPATRYGKVCGASSQTEWQPVRSSHGPRLLHTTYILSIDHNEPTLHYILPTVPMPRRPKILIDPKSVSIWSGLQSVNGRREDRVSWSPLTKITRAASSTSSEQQTLAQPNALSDWTKAEGICTTPDSALVSAGTGVNSA